MKYLLSTLCLLMANLCFGQDVDMSMFENMSVRNIGPAGMSGRITAIDVDLSDKDHILVGSASGGVWESVNGGISWEPIFDDVNTLSIGDLAFNQSNPAEIWVGTGEGNPRNSINSGAGVYFSQDGGKNWTYMGLKETKLIHRILIDPSDSKTIYVGALGSAWGPNKERGVYKSTDKGKTWNQILSINDETGVADMVMDPRNPNKLIVAMWEFGRKPWTFNSGGEGSGLYVTYDGGNNWTEKTDEDGLPKGPLGRIGIAIAPSKPNIIYALVEAEENGLYVSKDGGEKWTLVSKKNIGGRPFYYAELYVDPKNENRIYNIHTYVTRSEDGGKSFESIMDYGNHVHPDHHAFWIDPNDSNYLIDGNDGGLNISRDGAATWKFVTNLPVGQFYHVNVDNDFPYNVYGGMQDNGSWVGPSNVFRNGGIQNSDWQELYFGDGFDVVPDVQDNRYGYAQSQGGNVARYDRVTGRTKVVKPEHPTGERLRFNWNAAIVQDPMNPCGLYFGSQFVHYSPDCGASWQILSPDLTTNDTTKQKQDVSGGLTIDATQAENYTTIIAIAPSPVDTNVVWVGTDDGNIQLTTNNGKTWKNVDRAIRNMPDGAWIPQIEVSQTNPAEAFVVVNNYRKNDWSAYTYHTQDYGKSWKRIVDDSQVEGFVCSIVQDMEVPKLLFLGTDVGLYVSFDYGAQWHKWDHKLPSVQIRDMKIQQREGDLVIGTFGRAFWIIDDISPLRAFAKNPTIINSTFEIINAPTAYLTSNRSYQGIRFFAQGEFHAPSKSRSAHINYYLKAFDDKSKNQESNTENISSQEKDSTLVKDTNKEKGSKKDKIEFWVLDQQRDTLRYQKRDAEEGFHQIQWRKRMKGVEYPSRNERNQDRGEPGGPQVPAGEYLIIVQYKDIEDSTVLVIKSDPRMDYDEAQQQELLQAQKSFHSTVSKATDAMDQLKLAKNAVETINNLTFALQDTVASDLKEKGKILLDSIETLMSEFEDPPGQKGIQRNPYNVSSQLGTSSYYLASRWDTIDPNTQNVIRNTTTSVTKLVDRVDRFMEVEFEAYQNYVENLEFELFKKLEKSNTSKD